MILLEDGVCILCGERKKGIPAKADLVILLARKIRALLSIPAKRTVACKNCEEECRKKSAEFAKRKMAYRYVAMAYVLILISGSFFYNGFGFWLIIPALLGSLFIICLPYAKYFPEFGFSEKK